MNAIDSFDRDVTAALLAVAGREGWSATTMAAIAEEAGCSLAALRARFGGREAVLLRLDPAACAGETCRYRVYRAAAPLALREESALLAEASGHAFADGEAAVDGRSWFYLVDDGGGWPGDSLRVARGAAIELSW